MKKLIMTVFLISCFGCNKESVVDSVDYSESILGTWKVRLHEVKIISDYSYVDPIYGNTVNLGSEEVFDYSIYPEFLDSYGTILTIKYDGTYEVNNIYLTSFNENGDYLIDGNTLSRPIIVLDINGEFMYEELEFNIEIIEESLNLSGINTYFGFVPSIYGGDTLVNTVIEENYSFVKTD